jgi:MFS transporter, MHS family, proline/betaine transporter
MMLFGGTAPFVATAMIGSTSNRIAPGGLIIIAAFLSMLGVLGMRAAHIK